MSRFSPYWKEEKRGPNSSLLKKEALINPTPSTRIDPIRDGHSSENLSAKKASAHHKIVKFLIGLCYPLGVFDYLNDYDQDGERRYWVNTAPSDWLDELIDICGEDPSSYAVEDWVMGCIPENWSWQVANTLADWAGKDPENWLNRVLDKMDRSNIEIILHSLWFVEPDFCQQFLELAWEDLPELEEIGFINLLNALGNGSTSPEFASRHFSLLKERIDPTMKDAWHELNIFLPRSNL